MVQFMVQCQMVQLCQLVQYDVRWCMQVNDVLTDDVVCGMLYLAMSSAVRCVRFILFSLHKLLRKYTRINWKSN